MKINLRMLTWLIPVLQAAWKLIRRKKNMADVNIKELAEKAVADLKGAADVVDGIKAVKAAWASESNLVKKAFKAVSAAVALITDVIGHVETLGKDLALAGAQKRELAVEIINRLIDIPWLPENMEGMIIGFAIDTIVTAFNRKLGNGWLSKIA